MPAPRLTLEGRTYGDWFANLSRHRRAEFRRRRRRLEERGAVVRLVEDDDLDVGIRAFCELHHSRWRGRGGSGVLNDRIEAMLADAMHELAPSSRFRLWNIEVGGRPISSALFVGAGGALSYWLGGFDEEWAAHGPAIETVRAALEHAWAAGDRVLDFGPGGQHYKYIFADEEELVQTIDLVPRVAGYVWARMHLAPDHAAARVRTIRYEAFRRLSPDVQQRLKAMRRRLRPSR